ncbi:hypothetical protein BC939DRAFT_440651 [Gamsiella multidivaricata]|uniref:uncharacterized protein n=1 Tax=Gamsiella multidivaricata TaxID=101098 RepID=UPI00221F04FA|nr:uncharacterized protein BC939DRAFT_440651 [Gamsiella multidivaricata]KAG0367162.1 hypothetical protein BGZ54_004306 [Gamsiella multidivaricata]KAI7829798.1 hypothetical protein BC939DRAFT_440651 [Gamsiella multidivaricata]
MDSDWCLFCEKHVDDLGALYCSKECARMDKTMAISNRQSSSPSVSSPLLNLKRSSRQSTTVTYPSMFRVSTLFPASTSSRGGIAKGPTYSPIPATPAGIRSAPLNRTTTRRQPFVLQG